jgi:rare lipoprotein A
MNQKNKIIVSVVIAAVLFTILLSGLPCLSEKQLTDDRKHGTASYYNNALHGRLTASGEKYDKNKLTAAHKKYAFGTIVKITNLNNKKTVRVRINDRGPFVKGRIIDLSYAAALKLDMIKTGVAPVKIKIISLP